MDDKELDKQGGLTEDVAPEELDAAPEVDVAPDVIEEAPAADPNLLGTLEAGEMGVLTALQQQGRAIMLRIGELEVEKARMLGQLSNLEQQNQQHLQGVGKRLNIPQGVQWQVTNDGKVIKVGQPTPFRPQVVPPPKG